MVAGAIAKDVIFRIGSSGAKGTAIAIAAVAASVALLSKKILDVVKEAEEFNQVQSRVVIGMGKYTAATKGLIDTAEGYRGALALQNAEVKIGEAGMAAIGKAAIHLGRTTNQTATQAFKNLTEGIAKGSTRALKQLGIDLENTEDLVLAQAEAVEKITAKFQGYGVEIETTAERLFAFKNDLDTIKLQLVDAAWQNFQESVLDITNGLAGSNTALSEFSALLDETDGKFAKWLTSSEGLNNTFQTGIAAVLGMEDAMEDLNAERERAIFFAQKQADNEERIAEASARAAATVLKAEEAKQKAYVETAKLQLEALGIGNSLDEQFQSATQRALAEIEKLEKEKFKKKKGRSKKKEEIVSDVFGQSLSDTVDARLKFMEATFEAEQKLIEEQNDQRLRMQAEFEKEREKAIAESLQRETEMRKNAAAAGAQALTDLGSLMQTENEKAFNVGKAAAISEATISTFLGAQKAFSALAGIPIVGPVLGGIAAAAAITAGTIRVQQIASTEFGGGAKPSQSAATGAPSGIGSVASVNAQPEQEIRDRRPLIVNIGSRKITDIIVEDSIRSQQRGERGLQVRT